MQLAAAMREVPRACRTLVVLAATVALAACMSMGNPRKPIATILVPATEPGSERLLMVVLPGMGSDAQALKDHHVDEVIHKSWPQIDVLLTSATFAYYTHKVLVQRLEGDVLVPARQQGYRQIWLAGASVGAMGAILYEREYPNAVTGVVLFAPWMGTDEMLGEIQKAGGIGAWDPGPAELLSRANYQHEMWRVVKGWSDDPARASRVWLVCGEQDPLLEASRLVAPAFAKSHYLEVAGGHTWDAWLNSVGQVIAEIRTHANAADQRVSGAGMRAP